MTSKQTELVPHDKVVFFGAILSTNYVITSMSHSYLSARSSARATLLWHYHLHIEEKIKCAWRRNRVVDILIPSVAKNTLSVALVVATPVGRKEEHLRCHVGVGVYSRGLLIAKSRLPHILNKKKD